MKRLLYLAFALATLIYVPAALATNYSPPAVSLPGGVLWTANTTTGAGISGGIPTRTNIVNMTTGSSPYNCDPTGATDCHTNINTAAAAASAGDILYFPAGTYKLTGEVDITKNNITIRGAGDTTVFTPTGNFTPFFVGYGTMYTPNTTTISGSPTQGSTSITVGSGSGFSTGMLVQICEAPDLTIPVFSVSGAGDLGSHPSDANNLVQQKDIVTGVSGNTVTLQIGLNQTLSSSLNPMLFGTTGTGAQFQTSGVGLENFKLDCTNSTGGFAIEFEQCVGCWIGWPTTNTVHVYNTPGYGIYLLDCFQCEMDHSWIDTAQHFGTNGGGFIPQHSSNCLIQNNEIDTFAPLVEQDFGCTGNIYAYNFGVGCTVLGAVGGGFNSNHGPENSCNLYEANVFPNLQSDGYFGGEVWGTLFRNFFYAYSAGASPATRQAILLDRFSRQFNVVNNDLGLTATTSSDPNFPAQTGWFGISGGTYTSPYFFGYPNLGNEGSNGTAQLSASQPWADWNVTGTVTSGGSSTSAVILTLSGTVTGSVSAWGNNFNGQTPNSTAIVWSVGRTNALTSSLTSGTSIAVTTGANLPANTTAVTLYAGSNGSYQEKDLDAYSVQDGGTNIVMGNYDEFNQRQPVEDASVPGGTTMPASLYLSGKPSFLFSLQWPYFDASNHAPNGMLGNAAEYRYYHGQADPPASPTTTTSTGPFSRDFSLLFHH